MPGINYKRGETRSFIFQQEHGRRTHYTYHKGKRDSGKPWKRSFWRQYRALVKLALYRGQTMPPIHPVVRWRMG